MKKIMALFLVVFFILLSPISAYASTTESMMLFSMQQDNYAVAPTAIYDEDVLNFAFDTSIGDFNLDNWNFYSTVVTKSITANQRFSDIYAYPRINFTSDNLSQFDKYLKIDTEISLASSSDDYLYYPLLGLDLDIHGLYFACSYRDSDNSSLGYFTLTNSKPIYAEYRAENPEGSKLVSGSINLNSIVSSNNTLNIKLNFQPIANSLEACQSLRITLYYPLPIYTGSIPYSSFVITSGFGLLNNDNYVYGDFIGGSSTTSSQDDYNQNVEAELGNIQTGINNVVNSVMQMGQQVWQGAQQTVQAVTQMTQQLNTAIDQQRQDILEGLGLLGDDIDTSMNNVKTEISNMSSSISNKLESTTESITNKIESTTETITNTIETKVDQVTTAVEDVKESVTEVKQSILDLPNKIKDMLLGLIVPDSETMANKYSEFSQLLEEKLGIIYQIPMMLFDFFDTIVNAATTPQTTLTLPAFTLPWIDGTTLTIWQPIEYKIIPDGLQVLSDLIQTVTSMTVVVLTFNSVKQAYERFLRS